MGEHQQRQAAAASAGTAPRHDMRPEAQTRPSLRRRQGVMSDKFAVPPELIADGYTMEWKRWEIYGKHDPFYINEQLSNGWEPVLADQLKRSNGERWFPQNVILPDNAPSGAIMKDGMILMMRPVELTNEAKAELDEVAYRQVQDQIRQLGEAPPGTLDRPVGEVRVKTDYAPSMSID